MEVAASVASLGAEITASLGERGFWEQANQLSLPTEQKSGDTSQTIKEVEK